MEAELHSQKLKLLEQERSSLQIKLQAIQALVNQIVSTTERKTAELLAVQTFLAS